jgi:hypothetical protein
VGSGIGVARGGSVARGRSGGSVAANEVATVTGDEAGVTAVTVSRVADGVDVETTIGVEVGRSVPAGSAERWPAQPPASIVTASVHELRSHRGHPPGGWFDV